MRFAFALLAFFAWLPAFATVTISQTHVANQGACWRFDNNSPGYTRLMHNQAGAEHSTPLETSEENCNAQGALYGWFFVLDSATYGSLSSGGLTQEDVDAAYDLGYDEGYAAGFAAAEAVLFTQEDLDAAYADGLAADAVSLGGTVADLPLEDGAQLLGATLLLLATAFGLREVRKLVWR